MSYETRWAVRVREYFLDGVATTINPAFVVCFEDFSFDDTVMATTISTDCRPASVRVPGGQDNKWSATIPLLTPEQSDTYDQLLAGGQVISFELIRNPYLSNGNVRLVSLRIGVLQGTLIESAPVSKTALQPARKKINGSGGMWYPFRTGTRAASNGFLAFPPPFDVPGT